MILKNVHESWATQVEFNDPLDFFKQPAGFWRDLIYKRKLLIFKKMNFTKQDYAKFSLHFGEPWKNNEYIYSREKTEDVTTDQGIITLSPFSNFTNNRILTRAMPYHADIPNKKYRPFPLRSLWITKNPNPLISGITGFLNISQESFKFLTKEQQQLVNRVKIIQQSWYEPGTDFQEHEFIKIHPITKELSLRLNYFCEGNDQTAWIKHVKINDHIQPNCQLINEFITHLLTFPTLQYFHTWDTFDILIYDNYPFIHNRSPLILEAGEERHFYRMNIDHVDDSEFTI